VLQDRAWDETNTRIFPKTTQLLKDIGVRGVAWRGVTTRLLFTYHTYMLAR